MALLPDAPSTPAAAPGASGAPSRCIHFVTPRVAKILASETGDEPAKTEKAVAVLFVDIVGCTLLCEDLSPRDMNALTERYFSRFFDVIQEYDGSVSEIMGDGFMAIFESQPYKCTILSAARAAAAIRGVTLDLRAEDGIGGYATDVHMGLHAGAAYVGFTRFQARRWERWTYTASGPVTNIAARLCNLAGAGTILVSEEVAGVVRHEYDLRAIGTPQLRNVRHPLRVYELRDRRDAPRRGTAGRAGTALADRPHEATGARRTAETAEAEDRE